MEKVRVDFSNEDHKGIFSKKVMDEVTDEINRHLKDLREVIFKFNAHVEAIFNNEGYFKIVPVCDNAYLYYKMVEALPDIIDQIPAPFEPSDERHR